MVFSQIQSKVQYTESKKIDPEDIGHESTVYTMDIYDIPVAFILGKPKYTFSSKNIVFYPIYLISNEKIKSQIGIFETISSKTISLIDDDGDIDISKLGEPLLYPFAKKKYIEMAGSNVNEYIQRNEDLEKKALGITGVTEKEKENKKESPIDASDESETDETDVLKLKVPATKISSEKTKTDDTLKEGIFTKDPHFREPALLPEELETNSAENKAEYKESPRNNWIQQFMKNNHYDIVETVSNGDCFFDVIRLAFHEIGKRTTINKLRAIVANQVTDEVFQENRKLYMDYQIEIQRIKEEMNDLKKTVAVYKKRIENISDGNTTEMKKAIERTEIEKIKEDYKKKAKLLKDTETNSNTEVGFMKDIDSLDKYRAYMQTSSYWADTFAISTLEMVLKIKMIILSESAHIASSFDTVLQCGEVNKQLQAENQFEPLYYIITSYSGSHYRLITYKKKGILTFKEIPYDIKILTVNKCLERNAGIFNMIADFKNFKSQLGLDVDVDADESDQENSKHNDLHDSSTVFVFHSKSLDSKPGKGSGEHIETSDIPSYITLSRIKDWRRKLDDSSTEMPITIDGHRWSSVEHYLQGAKFKKGFPDFYTSFSLDHPSDLSNDPELARMVADTSKTKYKEMRPKNVRMDVDYSLGRNEKERELAIHAKFTQNEPLKQLLLSTGNALLKLYLRRKPAETDTLLMKVRSQLR